MTIRDPLVGEAIRHRRLLACFQLLAVVVCALVFCRQLIGKFLPVGETLANVPPAPNRIAIPRIDFEESASLWSLLGKPVRAEQPTTTEAKIPLAQPGSKRGGRLQWRTSGK